MPIGMVGSSTDSRKKSCSEHHAQHQRQKFSGKWIEDWLSKPEHLCGLGLESQRTARHRIILKEIEQTEVAFSSSEIPLKNDAEGHPQHQSIRDENLVGVGLWSKNCRHKQESARVLVNG